MIVILSTHIVEDVKELCSNMAVINDGRVLFAGAPEAALLQLQGKIWEKAISKADMEDYQSRYQVISSKLVAGKPIIHIFSQTDPAALSARKRGWKMSFLRRLTGWPELIYSEY